MRTLYFMAIGLTGACVANILHHDVGWAVGDGMASLLAFTAYGTYVARKRRELKALRERLGLKDSD